MDDWKPDPTKTYKPRDGEPEGLTMHGLSKASEVPTRTLQFWADRGVLKAQKAPGGRHRRFGVKEVLVAKALRTPNLHNLGVATLIDMAEAIRACESPRPIMYYTVGVAGHKALLAHPGGNWDFLVGLRF